MSPDTWFLLGVLLGVLGAAPMVVACLFGILPWPEDDDPDDDIDWEGV